MQLKVILLSVYLLATETPMEVNSIVVPVAIATAIISIVVTTAIFLIVLVMIVVIRRKSGEHYTNA